MLTSINAGHNFPLMIRRDGSLERLEKGGLVLGMYPADMLCRIMDMSRTSHNFAVAMRFCCTPMG